MKALIRTDAAEAARCVELAHRARHLRMRAAAVRAGAQGAMTPGRLLALARGLESQLRMAADAALDEAARVQRQAACEVCS